MIIVEIKDQKVEWVILVVMAQVWIKELIVMVNGKDLVQKIFLMDVIQQ